MTDAVGHDAEILAGVQRLSSAEQLAGEFRTDELPATATGAVSDEHGIPDDALRVLLRLAEDAVVNAQFRQRFAAGETEILQRDITFGGRRILRGADRVRCEQGDAGKERGERP